MKNDHEKNIKNKKDKININKNFLIIEVRKEDNYSKILIIIIIIISIHIKNYKFFRK